MNQFAYRPGTWQVIAEGSGVIAVPGDVPADRIGTLTRMMRDGSPQLTEVIDVLTAGSITRLGSFAIALVGTDFARFAVRGDITLQVTGADGDEIVSGAEISTWAERYIVQPRTFALTLEESASAASLSVRSGVVLASSLAFGDDERADRSEDVAASAEPVIGAAVDAEPASAAAAPEPAGAEPDGLEPHSAEAVESGAAEAGAGETVQDESESAATEEAATEEAGSEEAEAEAAQADAAGAELPQTEALEPAAVENEAEAAETENVDPEAVKPEVVEAEAAETEAIEKEAVAKTPVPDASAGDAGFPTLVPSDFTFAPDVSDESLDATIHAAPYAAVPPSAAALGDHDGATISVAELRRLRGETAGPDAPTAVLPTVEPSPAPHGIVRVSTGQVVELDRTVIIGRRPRATRASGDNMPHLVAVESPEQDISRSHLEIRPEGDSVVVIDLHTTNGSTLLRPGADPVRLHPGEQTLVLSGDVVDLGDGVTVVFEGLT